ncbi:MAG: esterase/lipase family protein [Archangium sp.]
MRGGSLLFLSVVLAACGGDRLENIGDEPVTDAGVTTKPTLPSTSTFFAPPSMRVPPRGPPYPVVFVHGMAGFDALRIGGVSMDYFGDTVQDLTARGEEVYRVVLPPFDSSTERAAVLSQKLNEILTRTNAAKLNIVAHSQGGIDSRLVISPAGLARGDVIATLVTISSPHRGTRVANVATGISDGMPDSVSEGVFDGLAGMLSTTVYEVERDAHLRAQLAQMTEATMADFNRTYVNDPRVRYLSWAGRSNLHTGISVCDDGVRANQPWKVDLLLPLFSGVVIATEWGLPPDISDGLVTVKSAKWGTFMGCVPADHLDEVGMPNVNGADLSIFDSRQFMRDIVAELRTYGH